MGNESITLWGVHAGPLGEADQLFKSQEVIALGWADMGDLSVLPGNREAFKQQYAKIYPDDKPGAIPVQAGQLFRFVHEMKIGDLVLYPSKRDKRIHVGEVIDEYKFTLDPEPAYPQQRSIKWLESFPRKLFTQGALYEIGSAMSLFQVSTYAEEYLAALKGQTTEEPLEEDETVSAVVENIQQSTRDFIQKRLSAELKGHPFAHLVADLLETMGYRTQISPPGPDMGIDIVAYRDELGFEPPIVKVQVKSGEGTVGSPDVQALSGVIAGQDERGLFVTLGVFSSQAVNFANGKSNLRLVDGEEFIDLLLEHYEELDSWFKGLLPLKRVYVPEIVSSD